MTQKKSKMDKIILTPEELAAEQAAQVEVKEEEVKTAIIEEFGFDEFDDAEKIDKAVAKEMKSRKDLSLAIGQKIKHRTEAEELRAKVITPKSPDKTDSEDLDKKLDERFEKRDLESLGYPEDLTAEIQRVVKTQGVSVKKAAQDPYIVFKIEAYEKEQKINEATISRTNKTGGKTMLSLDNPPEVDMQTEEGRKEYDDWKKEMKKQGF